MILDQLTEKQQKRLKMATGVVTLIGLVWFVQTSGVVFESVRPTAESGKLGSPTVAGALIVIAEILAVISGVMLVMFTGLWKYAAGFIAPLFGGDAEPEGLTAEQFVQAAIATEKTMPPERRAQLQQALLISVDRKDWKNIIVISELLAGEPIFKRSQKEVATDGT